MHGSVIYVLIALFGLSGDVPIGVIAIYFPCESFHKLIKIVQISGFNAFAFKYIRLWYWEFNPDEVRYWYCGSRVA